MNQKLLLAFLLVMTVVMGGIVIHDVVKNDRIGQLGKSNWGWNDNWGKTTTPQPITPVAPIAPKPPVVDVQLIAPNYEAALRMSGTTGKPVLVFFEADWCVWCKKMKNETFVDPKVKEAMKNYILVFVDIDGNRKIASKFDSRGVPSYAITNYKEDKLKVGSGFMKVEDFVKWLTNPNLYNQPKAPGSPPDLKPDPETPKRPWFR